MRKYHIEISQAARRDIIRNTDYIAIDKQSPETARTLARGFRKQINSLDTNPQRHEFDEDEELKKLGVRKHYYKNYKIYYQIDEENGVVNIVRVLHMLVNSKAVLKKQSVI